MSLEAYISGLKLSKESGATVIAKSGGDDSAPPLDNKLKAAIDAGSILSFADDLDVKQQSDVLYSVQLAQRVADTAFNRFAETKSWYGKYNEVLEAVGWMTEQFAFSGQEQVEGKFRMDKAALAVVNAIAVGNQLGMVTASIAALEKLAATDDAITLFEKYAAADYSGNFQIGAAQRGERGLISIAMGAFYFRAVASQKKFLFCDWGGDEINFWFAAQKMTLNVSIYDKVREKVSKKLGKDALTYIEGLEIN